MRVSFLDQAVKLSFKSKDDEDDEQFGEEPDGEPDQQSYGKKRKRSPDRGSDSGSSFRYYYLGPRNKRRRVCLARDNRIRKVVIWRFLMCVRIRRVATDGRD